MNILVLGHKGMLGHIVVKYLQDQNINVNTISYRYPSEEFKKEIKKFKGDYIINCIGAIPQKTNIFLINTELPIWLSQNSNVKIIHPGTDCEMDNDEYGISKRLARDYILNKSKNTKIIKTSIIGPELNSKSSLFEWFLNNEIEVKGYTKVMWSGITTLEWVKQCLILIYNWELYEKENIIKSTCLSKYNLLSLIKEIFNKNINIIPDDKIIINKCLTGNIEVPNIKIQLQELKDYYYTNDSI
jgi:dTDP-4-dehydrorhamnose reductase